MGIITWYLLIALIFIFLFITLVKWKKQKSVTRRSKLILGSMLIVMLLLVSGLINAPHKKVWEAVKETQEAVGQSWGIEITPSLTTDSNVSEVTFSFLFNEAPSEEEAINLFNEILEGVVIYSKKLNLWDNYDAYFDIKSESNIVIYRAEKPSGQELTFKTK
ncbi:MAG: hypothetical protein ACK4M9_22655 [Anaerobacillus sp.]|uniref:hypothetical protein n=1 Tax=Anaerobacillus sp. TaxID=1872506 RepID=UPI003919C938